jgi:hypothetical protein
MSVLREGNIYCGNPMALAICFMVCFYDLMHGDETH